MSMTDIPEGAAVRRLGAQEQGWHELFSAAAGASLLQYSLIVESQQQLSVELLQQALDRLQRQVPILRTRVEERDGAPHLVATSADGVKLKVLPPGGDWLQHHQRLLQDQQIDATSGPLWTAAFMQDPTNVSSEKLQSDTHRAVIYLSICHTITDGLSNAMIYGRLLKNLEFLLRGEPIPEVAPVPIPACIEDLLKGHRQDWSLSTIWTLATSFLARIMESSRHRLMDKYVKPYDAALAENYSTGTIATAVPAADMSRLKALCRAHGVSLNAAVSAAVSVAGARMTEEELTHADVQLPTVWLVDARRYLGFPGESHFSSTVASVESNVRVHDSETAEFWTVAEHLGRDLRRKLTAGEPISQLHSIAWKGKVGHGGLGGVETSGCVYSVNNMGALDAHLPRGGAVRAVELHRSVKAAPALTTAFGSHCFQMLNGVLFYDLNYVKGRVSEEDARRFARIVVEVLTEVATPNGEETDHE